MAAPITGRTGFRLPPHCSLYRRCFSVLVMAFRVVVAGSRSFGDFGLMFSRLDVLLSQRSEVVIISGAARGADALGERYAALRGLPVERFPADWARFGRAAGYRRNEAMAAVADAVVVFWDGRSPGTGHMVDIARSRGLPLRVVRF